MDKRSAALWTCLVLRGGELRFGRARCAEDKAPPALEIISHDSLHAELESCAVDMLSACHRPGKIALWICAAPNAVRWKAVPKGVQM